MWKMNSLNVINYIFLLLASLFSVTLQIPNRRATSKLFFQSPEQQALFNYIPSTAKAQPNHNHDKKTSYWPLNYCGADMMDPVEYKPLKNAGLVNVQIIHRHGDRSPNHVLPFEDVTWHCDTHEEIAFSYSAHSRPHSTTKKRYFTNRRLLTPTQEFGSAFWQGSCVQGQLTARGARQLATLGSIMREIYIERMHLLHDKYKHGRKQWWVRSTDIWRTKQSAEAFFNGLYPIRKRDSVFTLNTYPLDLEDMTGNKGHCPRLQTVINSIRDTKEWQMYWNESLELWESLSEKLEFQKSPYFQDQLYYPLADVFRTRLCHGHPLPCSRKDPNNCVTRTEALQTIANAETELHLEKFASNNTLVSQNVRLGIGGFLKELMMNVEGGLKNDESNSMVDDWNDDESDDEKDDSREERNWRHKKKLFVYSGHDDTISYLLGAFGANEQWPPYASHIVIELWRLHDSRRYSRQTSSENHVIRILYNGAPLNVGWCDFQNGCNLESWIQWVKERVPGSLRDECGM